MGIPIYYRKILENHPECIYTVQESVDELLIDFNAFIYNVIPTVDQTLSPKNFEEDLIKNIIKQLSDLINHVKPRHLLYIAMDGPPPKAKIIQQRSRRFKSLKEKEFIKELEKKYKINIPHCKWDKNSISPGTKFMSTLTSEIIKTIKNNQLRHNDSYKNYTVIFSSDLVAGEGEHKIMNHISKSFNHKIVIYSPDADVIVLSILNKLPNIHILRTDDTNNMSYLNIDILRSKIESSFHVNRDVYRILKDYSFLTFLCGNDFVHSVTFLKIKDNGIDTLIKIYTDISNQYSSDIYLLDNNNKINNMFLFQIIKELSVIENDKLKLIQKKRHHVMKKNPETLKDSEQGKLPWQIEFSRFQHEEYFSPLNPKYNPYIFNKINYYDPNWSEQYNNFFFKNIDINDVCFEYYRSIQFCTDYYFNNKISWDYFYKYRTSPTMKDFSEFLKVNLNINIPSSTSKPYKPFEQLLMILPNKSHSLLPISIRSNKPDIHFELDIVNGNKFVYSEVILPIINDDEIITQVKNSNFSLSEIRRNTIKEHPFKFKHLKQPSFD